MKDVMPDKVHVDVRYGCTHFGLDLNIAIRTGDGRVLAAQPLTFKEVERGAVLISDSCPTMRLDEDAAKQLMDALWQAGIRPSRDVASTGQLEAMREHIADLRRIAFARSHAMNHADQGG